MPEYGFFLTRMFPHKDRISDRIFDFVLIRENAVRENPYSGIFYAVFYYDYFCVVAVEIEMLFK